MRGWWERRFGKAVEFLASSGGELDLHLAITGGYFGARVDHDELWSTASEPFDLDGVQACGLDREGRLLQACCHTVLGGGSGLRAVRDVAQLVLISGADWQVVVERAQRDGIGLVIAGAVHAAWTELGLDHQHPLLQWAAAFVPDTVQERAFAGYRAASDEGWAPEGLTMLAALTPADRVRFLAGLAIPSPRQPARPQPFAPATPPPRSGGVGASASLTVVVGSGCDGSFRSGFRNPGAIPE